MTEPLAGLPLADRIASVAELEALYGDPPQRALDKEIDHLNAQYQAFIEASPFLLLATTGPEGLDCSPRGDPGGFVRVADPKTLLLPDRRGNNRADSLKNIVRQRKVALLFMIPGIGETLRVNGHADVVVNAALNDSFSVQGKPARSVIVVQIDSVYFQCQKALARSRLWASDAQLPRSAVPTAGEMLQAIDTEFDASSYDANYSEHMRKTIY